jgi:CarD family transcriptional regulator
LGKEIPVTLIVGSKVVYPCQGPCLVGAVVEKVVAGRENRFYHLIVLADTGGELFTPLEKVRAIGVRLLLKKSDIPGLLGRLMTPANIAGDRRQRAEATFKRFTSGSAFDLAEVVESLTELEKTKMLTLRESWTLARARNLLICEISEVMGETKSAAEERVDRALNARKTGTVRGVTNRLSIAELGEWGQHPTLGLCQPE